MQRIPLNPSVEKTKLFDEMPKASFSFSHAGNGKHAQAEALFQKIFSQSPELQHAFSNALSVYPEHKIDVTQESLRLAEKTFIFGRQKQEAAQKLAQHLGLQISENIQNYYNTYPEQEQLQKFLDPYQKQMQDEANYAAQGGKKSVTTFQTPQNKKSSFLGGKITAGVTAFILSMAGLTTAVKHSKEKTETTPQPRTVVETSAKHPKAADATLKMLKNMEQK